MSGVIEARSVKVGDRVAWLDRIRSFMPPAPVLATVTRLTPTQIVVQTSAGAEYRFDRTTGRVRGGPYSVQLLRPDCREIVEAQVRGIARKAMYAIERMAAAARYKNVDSAKGELGKARLVIDEALDEITQLLAGTPEPTEGVES